MQTSLKITVIRPGGHRVFFLRVLPHFISQLWSSRYLLWQIFLRDFQGQFQQKLLGYLWIFITPIVGILSFLILQASGALNPGVDDIPYPLFVLVGMTFWAVFIAGYNMASHGLSSQVDLLMKTNISRVALALHGLGHHTFTFVTQTLVIFAFCLYLTEQISPMFLIYPLFYLPLITLGLGIGLGIGVIQVIAKDIAGIVSTLLGLLMFISPVIYYPNHQNAVLHTISTYNPLFYLIDSPRQWTFTDNPTAELAPYFYSVGFSFLVLWIGAYFFFLFEDKIAEKI